MKKGNGRLILVRSLVQECLEVVKNASAVMKDVDSRVLCCPVKVSVTFCVFGPCVKILAVNFVSDILY